MEILSSFVTISSGNGSSLARLSSSALSRSRCRFDGFPGLKTRFERQDVSKEQLMSSGYFPDLNISSIVSRNHGQILGENTTHKHHTMSRL